MQTQLKNNSKRGYTKFYNDLLEDLYSSKFGSLEIKVILAIIRKTYGYRKEYAEISLRLFGKMIKTNHGNIFRVLERLVNNEIINRIEGVKIKKYNTVHKYAINEESLHRWHTRKGLSNTPETGVSNTPIKYKKKNIKERLKLIVDNMKMN